VSDEPGFDGVTAQAYPMELPNVGSWATPPRVGADLARQVRACLADLPWYFITPFLRRWHRTWGATSTEAAAEMPGDDLLPRAQYRCTRAINIDASPAEVWPWLVQVGYRRAGWYAGDLLDNFARPSVRRIVSELQTSESVNGCRWSRIRPSGPRSWWTATTSRPGCCGAHRIAAGLGV
jgi:hypothetical protein